MAAVHIRTSGCSPRSLSRPAERPASRQIDVPGAPFLERNEGRRGGIRCGHDGSNDYDKPFVQIGGSLKERPTAMNDFGSR